MSFLSSFPQPVFPYALPFLDRHFAEWPGLEETVRGSLPWTFVSLGLWWVVRLGFGWVSSTYAGLKSSRDRAYWTVSVLSTIHGITVFSLAVSSAMEAGLWTKNDFFLTTKRTAGACHVLLGYIFGDLLVWLCNFHQFPDGVLILVHHVITLWSVGDMCASGFGHNLALIMLVMEATAPFVNFRYFMSKAGMKDSLFYLVNGLGMLFSWFFLRILGVMFGGYLAYHQGDQVLRLPTPQLINVVTTFSLGGAMQVFWFYKILRGAIKALGGGSKKKIHVA